MESNRKQEIVWKMSTGSTINGYFQASVSVFTLMLELKRLLIIIIKLYIDVETGILTSVQT